MVGVSLIAVVWIICKHSFKAILLLISISILETTISENSVERIVSEVILITIVMGVGFSFRVLTDRENTYIKKLAILRQESASAEASIRKELAIHLHDTIAKELGLSKTTVRAYVSELFVATGYTNRGELTITAIKAGY